MTRRRILATACLLLAASVVLPGQQGRPRDASDVPGGFPVITPTSHPPVPRELSGLWLAPERGGSAQRQSTPLPLARAVQLFGTGEYTKALAVVSQTAGSDDALSRYAAFYAGLSQLRLNRADQALATFRSLQAQKPVGYLSEAAALAEAEALEGMADFRGALPIYERLLAGRVSDPELVYMRLGAAAKAAGDSVRAAEAFAKVLYDYPLGANAPSAHAGLLALRGHPLYEGGVQQYRLELERAERLFGAKRYSEARSLFDGLRAAGVADDEELLRLRIAECDYFLKRARAARESLRPLSEKASRQGEALFFYALASRSAGDTLAFVTTLHRIASEFPEQTWAEDALDNLATHYIRTNDDESADGVFRELYRRYPRGTYAERAAWKSGWHAYRSGDYQYAARTFEQAASDFPRSDYRPPWIYWSGRAHEQLGDTATARERYLIAATDYMNSYYGRLAARRVDVRGVAPAVHAPEGPSASFDPALPANGTIVRALLDAGMFDDALNELRYAQHVYGNSAAIDATIAWTRRQQSRTESGMRRFQLLRGSITTMRRAYPQFMAAGGEQLPREVLTVIYPLAYWDLIRRHAEANGLDPYFVAALVAQESTFVADVKSSANAYGLMQLLPSTARRYAARLKMPYSARLLTTPEANIRLGTAYLADQIREFGDLHLVLAAYNAGERAVRRWQTERPGLEVEEFIDDIPYPETQNYAKKILGTADDYRRLYGGIDAEGELLDTAAPLRASTPAAVQPSTPASTARPAHAAAPRAAAAKKPAVRRPVPRTPASRSRSR